MTSCCRCFLRWLLRPAPQQSAETRHTLVVAHVDTIIRKMMQTDYCDAVALTTHSATVAATGRDRSNALTLG